MSINAAERYPPTPSMAGVGSISRVRGARLRTDSYLILCLVALLGLGALMVFSTSAVTSQQLYGAATRYLKSHLLHVALGLCIFIAIQRLDPRAFESWARPLMILSLLSLIAVLIPGISHLAGGARRWLAVGPIRVQPGEIAKLVAVIYFAAYCSRHHGRLFRMRCGVLIPLGITGLIAGLLLLQPDFGSAVVILLVVGGQLLAGGARVPHLLALGGLGAAAASLLIFSSPYRMRRFQAFMDPFNDPANSGYQLIQSLIAVGSGGLTGLGLGAGKQKLFYLPAAHTDFIFAVIAEELGLLGAGAVVLLFMVVAWRGLTIARRLSGSVFLATLAAGLTLLIVVPALLNIAVVTGLLPTKGMVLPLVSYGGTAMIMYLAAFGFLVRLSRLEPE